MPTTAAAVALALVAAAPSLMVSPGELRAAVNDPALVVLHVASRESEFEAGHIPGARFVRYAAIADDGDALGSELPPVPQLVAIFERLGVSDASRVVVYGSPIAATRLFFTLDYLGHPNVRVLNGGLAAWKAENGAIETGGDRPLDKKHGAARFTPRVQEQRRAMADWIEARLDAPDKMALVDARPDAEFTGADGGMGGAHAPGHIPGARQLVWNTLLAADGRFLPDAELGARLEGAGARLGVPVVSYCMVGMRASVLYFVARHLGYDARMYDGSMVDWSRRLLPVIRGR